jgi:hypothetical protein
MPCIFFASHLHSSAYTLPVIAVLDSFRLWLCTTSTPTFALSAHVALMQARKFVYLTSLHRLIFITVSPAVPRMSRRLLHGKVLTHAHPSFTLAHQGLHITYLLNWGASTDNLCLPVHLIGPWNNLKGIAHIVDLCA